MLLILLCDFTLIISQANLTAIGSIVVILVYNVFVIMALWSLIATMVSDPGFVPKGYRYDFTRLTRLTK